MHNKKLLTHHSHPLYRFKTPPHISSVLSKECLQPHVDPAANTHTECTIWTTYTCRLHNGAIVSLSVLYRIKSLYELLYILIYTYTNTDTGHLTVHIAKCMQAVLIATQRQKRPFPVRAGGSTAATGLALI